MSFSYGESPYDIHIELMWVGVDVLAVVTGGTRAHVGAVALAESADAAHPVTGEAIPVKTGDTRVSVLTGYGHKDTVLAEMFAKELCEKYGRSVCVTAGVHVDGAGLDEIALMLENSKQLLRLI